MSRRIKSNIDHQGSVDVTNVSYFSKPYTHRFHGEQWRPSERFGLNVTVPANQVLENRKRGIKSNKSSYSQNVPIEFVRPNDFLYLKVCLRYSESLRRIPRVSFPEKNLKVGKRFLHIFKSNILSPDTGVKSVEVPESIITLLKSNIIAFQNGSAFQK